MCRLMERMGVNQLIELDRLNWGIRGVALVSAVGLMSMMPATLAHGSPTSTSAFAASSALATKTQVGKLHVKVSGLPKGSKAKVMVTGPRGYTKTLTKTATVAKLKPGTYRVKASGVAANGMTYRASSTPTTKVTVAANKKATIRIRYLKVKPPASSGAPTPGVSPTPSAPPVPPTPAPEPTPKDLVFDLADAAGVAVPATSYRERQGLAPEASTGSPLLAVDGNGQMKGAIVSGELPEGVHVAATFSGPHKRMAIAYGGYNPFGFCRLGLVDRRTGQQTCLEVAQPNLSLDVSSAENYYGYPTVQFDAQGRVYYAARGYSGAESASILRRHDGTSATDLMRYGNVSVLGWIVASDGTVVVTGQTQSSGQMWTRAISPAGAIQSLPSSSRPLPVQFPDGNVYLGVWGDSQSPYGIRRYLVEDRKVESGYWMANLPTSDTVRWDTSTFCGVSWAGSLCSGGYDTRKLVTTRSDEVWGIDGRAVVRLFPSPAVVDVGMHPALLAAVGNRIAVSGSDADGNPVTRLYNPNNGVTRTLLGPDNEVDVFTLNYVPSSGLIMFDGVRYSDGKYVVGVIDPASGVVSMDTATKMSQVVTFDE